MKTITLLGLVLSLVACSGTTESEAVEEQDLQKVKVPFVDCTLYDNTADWEYATFYFAKTIKEAEYKVATTMRNKPGEIRVVANKKGIVYLGFTPTGNGGIAEDAPADGSWSYRDTELPVTNFEKGNRDFTLSCHEVSMERLKNYERMPQVAEPE